MTPAPQEPTSTTATTVTISSDQARAEAQLLDRAEIDASQIRQSTANNPHLTIADAYLIQSEWLGIKRARGEQIVGHKIGLTSRAMQTAMSIDTPDSGFLTDAMVFEPDSTLVVADFCDPKVEIEVAFTLARDLAGPNVDITAVLAATEFVQPAVELIAARSYRRDPDTGRTRTVVDTIADNAANAGIISGGRRVAPGAIDLAWIGAVGSRNGTVEETGLAAGVLGHPAAGIAWLARRYHDHGLTLNAGQVILAGSFTRPIDVSPGDEFGFDFGPLGSFTLHFT